MSKKDDKVYLEYIAYFIKNVGAYKSKNEWVEFLESNGFDKKSEASVKKIAIKLYYIQVLDIVLRIGDFYDKSNADLKKLVEDLDAALAKHDVSIPVMYHLEPKKMLAHMKDMSEGVSVIDKLFEVEEKPKKATAKKTVAKKPAAKKTTTKKSAATTAKKSATTKPAPKKAAPKKTQQSLACKEMKVEDLRKMAAEQKIVGRSKMSKAELCIALGIK